MNLKTRLEHYFKIRKMRRAKSHIWIVPGGPDNKGIGYIQNYKVGTRSIRKALTFHLKQQDDNQKSLTYDDITHETIEEADEAYSTFCRPDEIRVRWPEIHLFSSSAIPSEDSIPATPTRWSTQSKKDVVCLSPPGE